MFPKKQMVFAPKQRVSVKARIGVVGGLKKSGGIQSRLGVGGGIADARQKINLRRSNSGRIGKMGDARQKIEAGRLTQKKRNPAARFGQIDTSPIKNLVITTSNSPPSSGGLFRNAVSGIGQWGYAPPPPMQLQQANRTSDTQMLTRTIINPLARSTPSFSAPKAPPSFMNSSYASVAKVAPSVTQKTGLFRSDTTSRSRLSREDDMEVDRSASPPPRSSIQSRLDSPKYKVRISNLQPTVSLDDIMELFSDIGELVNAKIPTPGTAECYYKSKSDCLKAVDAYHNRLLDGSPMKVSFQEESASSTAGKVSGFSPLKSASGATIKLPKSSSNIKIHPDLSAIHKVLFQPSSSSNAAKMLFKGAGH